MSDGLTFGERITHCQNEFKMSNEELSKRVGISEKSLCSYKKDNSKMTMDTLRQLCKLFHCKSEYLLDGTDTEAEYQNAIRMIRASLRA